MYIMTTNNFVHNPTEITANTCNFYENINAKIVYASEYVHKHFHHMPSTQTCYLPPITHCKLSTTTGDTCTFQGYEQGSPLKNVITRLH
jgi:hypothetical protein